MALNKSGILIFRHRESKSELTMVDKRHVSYHTCVLSTGPFSSASLFFSFFAIKNIKRCVPEVPPSVSNLDTHTCIQMELMNRNSLPLTPINILSPALQNRLISGRLSLMHAVHMNAARLTVITWIDWDVDDSFLSTTRQKSTDQFESSLSVEVKNKLLFFLHF